MARKMPSARGPILSFVPFLLSLITAILVVLILVSGTRPNFLDYFSFLKVDVSDLKISAKLAGSQILQDISKISGGNLVGDELTAKTLNLAPKYTVSLLASCGHGDETTCTSPRIGYAFDPRVALKLDNTAIAGTFKGNLVESVDKYSKLSTYLAIGYIAGFGLSILAPIFALLSSRLGRAGFSGAVMSWLATVLLFATSITAVLVFKDVNNAINDNFNAIGIKSNVWWATIPSWVAFAVSFIASCLFSIRRSPEPPRGRSGLRPLDLKSDTKGMVTGASSSSANPKPGFLQRIQTWRGQKYVQIEKQPVIVRTNDRGLDSEVLMDPMDGRSGVHDIEDDDIANQNRPSGIPLISIGNKRTKDVSTAYEPYARQS